GIEGYAEEREGLVSENRRHEKCAQRGVGGREVLDRRRVREGDVGEHSTKPTDGGRCVGAWHKKRHIDDIAIHRREQFLLTEGGEQRGVVGIDIPEPDRPVRGVGAHLDSGSRRREHDATRRVHVEEVGWEKIRGGEVSGNTVPIDFPAKTAEGAIRARDRAASEIDAKRIDRRRNGRSVGSRGEIDDRSAPCGWAEEQGDENRDNEENVLHGSPLPSQSPLRGRVGGDYSLLCWSTVRHLAATPTPAA